MNSNIMERHIQRTQTPTFFIFSDVHEGKHKPDDLERLIPSKLLYSPLVQILPIQPVTKAKMKKCLQTIAKAEGLSGSGSKSCSTLTPEFFEETHLSSGGDLRHAIFAMQFLCSNSVTRKRNTATEKRGHCSGNCRFWCNIHSISTFGGSPQYPPHYLQFCQYPPQNLQNKKNCDPFLPLSIA